MIIYDPCRRPSAIFWSAGLSRRSPVVWANILSMPSKTSFKFPRSKLPCAVKNSPGLRQRMNTCIAPRDRSVQRRIRLNHSIEIALTPLVKAAPDRRTRRGCSTSPVRFPRFSRSSTSDGRTVSLAPGTVAESRICEMVSDGRVSTSASACAPCPWTFCESLGAAALCCIVLWGLFLDRLGDGLLVASGLLRFLEFVGCNFFGFRIQLQRDRRGIVPHRTIIFGAIPCSLKAFRLRGRSLAKRRLCHRKQSCRMARDRRAAHPRHQTGHVDTTVQPKL